VTVQHTFNVNPTIPLVPACVLRREFNMNITWWQYLLRM